MFPTAIPLGLIPARMEKGGVDTLADNRIGFPINEIKIKKMDKFKLRNYCLHNYFEFHYFITI